MSEILNNLIHNTRRFKLATVLNLFGLVVAFATFYLLMTQIIYQRSFNHQVNDYQRLYRMETDYVYEEWAYSEHVCRPFADALRHFPQVESYSLVRNGEPASFPFAKGTDEVYYPFNVGNNTVVSALTGKAVDGSIKWTDDDQDGLIIPASIAQNYFGTTTAANKEMVLLYHEDGEATDTIPFTVRGVYEDFPENSELSNCIYRSIGTDDILNFYYDYKCYVKFETQPDSIEQFANLLKQAIIGDIIEGIEEESYRQSLLDDMKDMRIKFTPLEDCYFEHETFSTSNTGYKSMLLILEMACLLVIIIAAINFLNFTLAESPMRIKGLNTRLVMGASRRSLRLGLCAECVIISLIACLTALLLCHLVSQMAASRQLMEGHIGPLDNPLLVVLTLGIAIAVGAVAGIYPAIFATSIPPAIALKGSFGLTPSGLRLRMVLLGMQLFVAMLMATYFGILILQSYYIFNSTYGYNKSRILVSSVYTDSTTKDRLRQKLLKIPGIESIAFSSAPLSSTDAHLLVKTECDGHLFDYKFLYTDYRFLSTMGIRIVEGRNFEQDDTAAVIINETARKQWEWINLGDKISANVENVEGDSVEVIGVCEDIRYGTMRISNNQPYCFIVKSNDFCNSVNVRISPKADIQAVKRQADEMHVLLGESNATPLVSFNKTLEGTYHNEFRFFKLIAIISLIFLIIAIIDVFCMTMFETEYRRKEIGIRKVSGATTSNIVWMLCKRYAWLFMISAAVAMPIASYFGWRTLQYFADHTPIRWWIHVAATILVGSITLATVAFQGWRVARENPTTSIKSE